MKRGLAAVLGLLALAVLGCKRPAGAPGFSGDLARMAPADQAMEQKIQPVVTCINRAFSHFEGLQPDYRQRMAQIRHAPGAPDQSFPVFVSFKIAPFERNGEFYRECEDGLDKSVAMQPVDAQLDVPAKDAAAAMRTLMVPGAQMEAYLEQKAYTDDGGAKGAQLDAVIAPLLDRIVRDSGQLRMAVFQEKAVLTQHELDAIEKKSGRNLDWHTRQTMQAASVANKTVQRSATAGTLTAGQVTAAMQPLQAAFDDTQSFLAAHPEIGKGGVNDARPVWFAISDSFSGELGRMRELRTALGEPAGPNRRSMINSDLQTVNMSYNGAVENYNSLRQFSPAQ